MIPITHNVSLDYECALRMNTKCIILELEYPDIYLYLDIIPTSITRKVEAYA
jgi:hypothetical protein